MRCGQYDDRPGIRQRLGETPDRMHQDRQPVEHQELLGYLGAHPRAATSGHDNHSDTVHLFFSSR